MTEHEIKVADHYWNKMKNWSPESLKQPLPALVNTFLLSSCLYYHLYCSVLSDADYDALAKHLLIYWDSVQAAPVWHKNLLSQDALRAGTLFNAKLRDYPSLLVTVAFEFSRRLNPNDAVDELLPAKKTTTGS